MAVSLIPGLFLIAHPASAATIVDAPESGVVMSEEGKAVIQWAPADASASADVSFQLQTSRAADFAEGTMLYEGPDRGTVVTGLPEGDYFYRVREMSASGVASEWSSPLTVRVDYPGRGGVTLLMGLGLVVFLATLTAIAMGHSRCVSERAAE